MIPATFLAMIYVIVLIGRGEDSGSVNEYNALSEYASENPGNNITARNQTGIIFPADTRCPIPAPQLGNGSFSTQSFYEIVIL